MLAWREEPVGRHHDRRSFDCGVEDLNTYLRRYARQNHESGGAKTFVAVSPRHDPLTLILSVAVIAETRYGGSEQPESVS